MRPLKWIFFLVIFLAAFPVFAFQGGAGFQYSIPKDQKIYSDLYLIGWRVDVEGEVDGNLFVLGGLVRVHGPVMGNVYLAGGQVEIDGPVAGDLNVIALNSESQSSCRACRMLALYADQSGNCTNDLLGFGVMVAQSGNVGGDTLMGGNQISASGIHYGNLFCISKLASVSGTVQGDSNIKSDSILLDPGAKLMGSIDYTSPNFLNYDPSQIKGTVTHHFPPPRVLGAFHFPWLYKLAHRVLSAVWLTVVGLFAVTTWLKRPSRAIIDAMLDYPWESFGIGLLLCGAIPGMAMFFIISVLGLPLGFILLGLFAIGIYVTRLFASLYIGERVLQVLEHHRPPYWQSLPIGVFIFTLVTSIPYVGISVSLVTIPLAFGGKFLAGRKFYRENPQLISPDST